MSRSFEHGRSENITYELDLSLFCSKDDHNVPKKRKIGIEVLKTQGQPQDNELMIFFKDIEINLKIDSESIQSDEDDQNHSLTIKILNKMINEMKVEYFKLFDHQRNILRMLDNY